MKKLAARLAVKAEEEAEMDTWRQQNIKGAHQGHIRGTYTFDHLTSKFHSSGSCIPYPPPPTKSGKIALSYSMLM